MAEATHTTNQFANIGNLTMVTATFTSPTNGQTWTTGLSQIDWAGLTIVEGTGDAADAILVDSKSGGVVTIEIVGTVGSAYGIAIGV